MAMGDFVHGLLGWLEGCAQSLPAPHWHTKVRRIRAMPNLSTTWHCPPDVLGLAKPIHEIASLVEAVTQGALHSLPGLPEIERLALLLDRLFDVLSET
jgi:hypothetical protein